jgi:hypothetical protein
MEKLHTEIFTLLSAQQIIYGGCETIYRPCSLGIYTQDSQCQSTTIHESTETTGN